MHSGFRETSINSKKDLLILRVFCTLQVFLVLWIVITFVIIPLGFTLFENQIFENLIIDRKLYSIICAVISLVLAIIIVWIKKWYPFVEKEDFKKIKNHEPIK